MEREYGMTMDEFVVKLNKIKKMEYVSSMRNGPIGIGYTLETLLGINKNNI
jgi:hypothetical protein